MTRPRTLIAHPGATSLLYPLVASLQDIDSAIEFHTSLYFDLDAGWGKIVANLPASLAEPLRQELGRRYRPGIDGKIVRRHRLGELVHILAARADASGAEAVMRWRNDRFDRAVARAVSRREPRNFIGFDGSSLQSIRAARRLGLRSILVQAIGHIDALIEMMRQERTRWPAFFATKLAPADETWLWRQRAEATEADIVAVPSDYVAATLIEHGTEPRRIRKIHYPCDIVRFPPPPPRSAAPRLRVLFVGAIGARKGIPYLLEAAAPLVRAGAMTLDLVGPLACPATALAPWQDIFRHRSGLAPSEMPAVYRQADLFVFPSLHEGQAMVCNEALASGVPLICTANAGTPIDDGVEGFVIPARDSAAIADRLQALIENRALLARMGIAARAHAEANDMTRFTERLRAILAD